MNDLSDMSDAGERTGSSNDELKVDPGNPDNDPNYKSSPTYFLGLRKPLVAAINGAAAGLGFSLRNLLRYAFYGTKSQDRYILWSKGTDCRAWH